ncbi:MAG: MBL fold metallo-hydrolase [Candidatus Thorarchaeota archaeon]
MLTVTVLGAAESVGKSCIMISDRDRRIILDAGIQLHPRRTDQRSTPPAQLDDLSPDIDAVLVSHAHIDHSAYVPALYRWGYANDIHLTAPTKDIVKILWKDHLKIEGETHFSLRHLDHALRNSVPHNYNRSFRLLDGISAEFYDASHILGSACILLDWDGTRIFYTGDINDAKTPFHDPNFMNDSLEEPIDILITETTNATRPLPSRKETTSKLTQKLLQCYSRGGKAIIPSFALGRSQEIQTYLIQEFDTFLDSYQLWIDGMILDINKIYRRYLTEKWVSKRLLSFLKANGYKSPFDHEGIHKIDEILPTGGRNRKRALLANQEKPIIILTTSGMIEGGPIYEYLGKFDLGSDPKNGLYIVGYQVEGTVGSDIIAGQRQILLNNGFGGLYNVNLELEVKRFQFSGHASQGGLLEVVKYTNPTKILPIHGEPAAQQRYIEALNSPDKIIPPYSVHPEYP